MGRGYSLGKGLKGAKRVSCLLKEEEEGCRMKAFWVLC